MGTTDNFCLRYVCVHCTLQRLLTRNKLTFDDVAVHFRWNDFQSNISSSFREIRDGGEFFDVTLCCDDGESRLQAHRVILAACSPLLRKILYSGNSQQQQQQQLLYLKGVDLVHLSAVLDFMYHGEVNVSQEDLASFLKVAEELSVKGLTDKGSKTDAGQGEQVGGAPVGAGGGVRGHKEGVAKRKPQTTTTTSGSKKRKVDQAASGSIRPIASAAPGQYSSSPSASLPIKTSPPHRVEESGSDVVADGGEDDDYADGGGEGGGGSGEMGEYGFDDYEVDDSNYGLEGAAREEEDQGEIVDNEEASEKGELLLSF